MNDHAEDLEEHDEEEGDQEEEADGLQLQVLAKDRDLGALAVQTLKVGGPTPPPHFNPLHPSAEFEITEIIIYFTYEY